MPIDLSSYSTKGPLDPYKVITDLRKIVTLVNRIEVGQTVVQGELRTVVQTVQSTSAAGGGGSISPPIGPFPSVIVDVALEGDGSATSPLSVRVDGVTVVVNGSNELEAVIPPDVITGTLTPTRIPYASAANVLSDSANLNWDNVNSRVGIGTAAPSASIHTTGGIRSEALTATRVPYASTGGLLADNALFVWDNPNNRLFVPTIVGGTGTTDDLILQTTSGVGISGAWMFFKVGNNGATTAMEINNSGLIGIGTTGIVGLTSVFTVRQANPPDIGYVAQFRSNLSCYVQVRTGSGANEQAGFTFFQATNDIEWRMAVTGNEGNSTRWTVIDNGAGTTTNVFYVSTNGNVLIDSSNTDPATGTKCLIIGDGTAPGNLDANTAAFFANDVGGTVEMFAKNEANEVNQLSGDITLAAGKFFVSAVATFLMKTTVALDDGAAAGAGTLTNAPTAGDPTKWIPIDDNGTTRYIPTWT